MSQSRSERFSFRHALGLSTVLHGLIAPLFVVSSVAFVGVGQSAEPLGFRSGDVAAVTTMTIEHRGAPAGRPGDTPAQRAARATPPRGAVSQAEGSAVLSVVRNPIATEPVEAATLAPKAE